MSPREVDSDNGDPVAVLAAAARQRRRAAARAPQPVTIDGEPEEPYAQMGDVLVELDEPPVKRPRRKVKRMPFTDEVAQVAAARGDKDDADEHGLITRGVHAGLGGLSLAGSGTRRLGLWGVTAVASVVMLVAVAAIACQRVPPPLTVTSLRVVYLPGPQLPPAEVLGLLRTFPGRGELGDPDNRVLDQLAAFLRDQPAVGRVSQVRLIHEPVGDGGGTLRRTIELEIGLRQPVMPAILASGERAWVDGEGHVLPGSLPAPEGAPRPTLRGLESASPEAVGEALALWPRLAPLLDAGLVTDIHLSDVLDQRDQRGLVLYTRHGSRLIWGRPGDERYGVERDQKIRDLVHTIRCQGDLSRVAMINVRFHQPFFTLKDERR